MIVKILDILLKIQLYGCICFMAFLWLIIIKIEIEEFAAWVREKIRNKKESE